MIRLTYVLRRRPEMSSSEFQNYLRDTHGPLIMRYSVNLRIRKYVQNYTIEDSLTDDLRGSRGPAWEGVEEMWWDSRQDVLEGLDSPEGREATRLLVEDEKTFVDLDHSAGWYGYEVPQINPTPENIVATEKSPLFKIYYVLHNLPTQSVEEAQFYWRVSHGPKVRVYAHAHRPLRYIQVHRLDDELNQRFAESRGIDVAPYYGHTELWFDRADWAAGFATPEGAKSMQVFGEDERNFIDLPRSAIWTAKEQVFIDRLGG
jgi:uncharacterized protein (TIGR02118 family)